jgi:hypothetical protein
VDHNESSNDINVRQYLTQPTRLLPDDFLMQVYEYLQHICCVGFISIKQKNEESVPGGLMPYLMPHSRCDERELMGLE